MKNISKVLVAILVIVFSGCSSVKNASIPVKEKKVLTQRDILNLEKQESELAQKRYDERVLKNSSSNESQPLVSSNI